jgi:hypothetical protein
MSVNSSTSGLAPTLVCLMAMREARAGFSTAVEAHAARHAGLDDVSQLDREHRRILRSEAVSQIAEFYYVLKNGGIEIPDGLRGFLERHNADMATHEASCRNGYTIGGLSVQRIRRARFSPAQINYVLHESAGGAPRFDQQSLQRIFTQIMSFETCRSVLVVLAEFGFLRRWEFNQVVIGSTGVLERLFHIQLEAIVNAMRQG